MENNITIEVAAQQYIQQLEDIKMVSIAEIVECAFIAGAAWMVENVAKKR